MSTRPITFRLDTTSTAGGIFQKWLDNGYQPRQIIETALKMLEGIAPEPVHSMSDATLAQLQSHIERLEGVIQTIEQSGGVINPAQQEAINDVLDKTFVQGMKRTVRPGFTSKPDE